MLKVMRVWITAVLLACAALAQDASPEQLFRDAVEAQRRGDYAAAVEKYQALIQLRPDVVEAHANLGAALAHLGRFDEAIAQYEQALAVSPDQPRIRLNLALAYYKTGRIDRAAAEFEKLHTAAPAEQQVTLLLADCWLQQGQNRKVVDLLAPLDSQYAEDAAFSYLYGTALMRDNQTDRGKQIMDRILRNGDSAEARVLMATARMGGRDYKGAKADLERAMELNPNLPGVHSLYGAALDRLMDAGARAAYEKELALNPNDFPANLNLGIIALHERRLDDAETLLSRALAVRPQDPGALLQYANLLAARDKRDEAGRILEDLIGRYPDFREAHAVLAGLYYREKRKADGDREREIIRTLDAKQQAKGGAAPDAGAAAH